MGLFDFFKRNKKNEAEQSEHLASDYRIVQIIGHLQHEYPFAESLLVLANDAKLGHNNKCNKTVAFLLPQFAWNQIVNISNHRLTWRVYEHEFSREAVYFPGFANRGYMDMDDTLIVWRHRAVPAPNGMSEVDETDINEIPGWRYKLGELRSQYYNNGWITEYPTFKLYVHSLATGYDVNNFWGWLFDNNMLNRYNYYTLPREYKILYNLFLDECDGY